MIALAVEVYAVLALMVIVSLGTHLYLSPWIERIRCAPRASRPHILAEGLEWERMPQEHDPDWEPMPQELGTSAPAFVFSDGDEQHRLDGPLLRGDLKGGGWIERWACMKCLRLVPHDRVCSVCGDRPERYSMRRYEEKARIRHHGIYDFNTAKRT